MKSLKRFGWQRNRWSRFYERSTAEYPNLLVRAGTPKITCAYPQEPCLQKRKQKMRQLLLANGYYSGIANCREKFPRYFDRYWKFSRHVTNFRRVRKIVKNDY